MAASQTQRLKALEDQIEGLGPILEGIKEKVDEGEVIFIDSDGVKALKRSLGKEKFEELFELHAGTPGVPDGFSGMISSTWNAGWMGKATVAMAGVGTVVSLGLLLDGIGALTGWDDIKLFSKFCGWYAG